VKTVLMRIMNTPKESTHHRRLKPMINQLPIDIEKGKLLVAEIKAMKDKDSPTNGEDFEYIRDVDFARIRASYLHK